MTPEVFTADAWECFEPGRFVKGELVDFVLFLISFESIRSPEPGSGPDSDAPACPVSPATPLTLSELLLTARGASQELHRALSYGAARSLLSWLIGTSTA